MNKERIEQLKANAAAHRNQTLSDEEFVGLCDTALHAMSESTGLWQWKLKIRQALGLKESEDAFDEIRKLRNMTEAEAGRINKSMERAIDEIREAAECPVGVDVRDWVREMRKGIDETREILGVGKAAVGKPTMAEAARGMVGRLNGSGYEGCDSTAGHVAASVQSILGTAPHSIISDTEAFVRKARATERELASLKDPSNSLQQQARAWEAVFEELGRPSNVGMKPVDSAVKAIRAMGCMAEMKQGHDDRIMANACMCIANEVLGGTPPLCAGITGHRLVETLGKYIGVEMACAKLSAAAGVKACEDLREATVKIDTLSKRFEAERKALDEQKAVNAVAQGEIEKLREENKALGSGVEIVFEPNLHQARLYPWPFTDSLRVWHPKRGYFECVGRGEFRRNYEWRNVRDSAN